MSSCPSCNKVNATYTTCEICNPSIRKKDDGFEGLIKHELTDEKGRKSVVFRPKTYPGPIAVDGWDVMGER